MAKRDPNKTARNITIKLMGGELLEILQEALAETGRDSQGSLNAFIGHKTDFCIDLKNDIIKSPEEYLSKWLDGLTRNFKAGIQNNIPEMYSLLKDKRNSNFRKYCEIFLRRSFLKHYDELSKNRPREDQAYYWFGLNNAQHGIFVTPRFNHRTNGWENDKSEIRTFTEVYWSIGHILKTGLCYQGENRTYPIESVESYLSFFYNQVRLTKSKYQLEIAQKYIEFVRSSTNPEKIPLLIPEVRYNSEEENHEYRLDFLVINPYTMDKIGFELSPWSTHGKLSGKDKSLKQLNIEAKGNFETQIKKLKAYFKTHNIYTIVFTDVDLQNIDRVFDEIKNYLNVAAPPSQLSFHLIDEYFGID